MAIKIEIKDGKIPENCFKLLIELANHRDECLDCTLAHTHQLSFNKYCEEGQRILTELSKQPEVSSA